MEKKIITSKPNFILGYKTQDQCEAKPIIDIIELGFLTQLLHINKYRDIK